MVRPRRQEIAELDLQVVAYLRSKPTREPTFIGEIAKSLGISINRIRGAINRLGNKGRIKLYRDVDSGVVVVRPTKGVR
ncbi:MAG: hypothetical protein AB1295_06295 [Candidatus Micrarchaeota archaeon]